MNKCGTCKKFTECVTVSGNALDIENTPEEITKCLDIIACHKYVAAAKTEKDNAIEKN